MAITVLKRLFVGSPLATAQAKHERLGKIAGDRPFRDGPLLSP